jgi:ABC-type sugar transport system substrate-binding protein
VAILTASEPTPQLEQRLEGLRAALGYRRIETIVTTEPNYHDAIRAIQEAETADHNKMIFGWVFLEDWPLKGMPALPWKPGKKPVVAIQSSPSAFIYADEGYLDALVVHPYYEWGYLGVEALVEKLHLGKTPESPVKLTSPRLVDWRNFEDYRENWKVWFK